MLLEQLELAQYNRPGLEQLEHHGPGHLAVDHVGQMVYLAHPILAGRGILLVVLVLPLEVR
jgi:hypothetical protein